MARKEKKKTEHAVLLEWDILESFDRLQSDYQEQFLAERKSSSLRSPLPVNNRSIIAAWRRCQVDFKAADISETKKMS